MTGTLTPFITDAFSTTVTATTPSQTTIYTATNLSPGWYFVSIEARRMNTSSRTYIGIKGDSTALYYDLPSGLNSYGVLNELLYVENGTIEYISGVSGGVATDVTCEYKKIG